MNDEFQKLNLEKFAHDYQSFYASACNLFNEAENKNIIRYILTDDINSQYKYSEKKRNGYPVMSFLAETYLNGEQEIFLSFFNEILPNILQYLGKEEWQYQKIPNERRSDFTVITYKFFDLIASSNNPSVFNLDFYYDKKNHDFRRKIDEINTRLINSNDSDLEGDNKIRYQECVSDFLLYKKDVIKSDKLFYNKSLDNLKKVVENTLQNGYKRSDGTFPRIHEKKQLSNILFNDSNSDFENFLDYVIKNVHHENGGQPKNFTEKEYVYLWLELNNILYLLNKHKAK